MEECALRDGKGHWVDKIVKYYTGKILSESFEERWQEYYPTLSAISGGTEDQMTSIEAA